MFKAGVKGVTKMSTESQNRELLFCLARVEGITCECLWDHCSDSGQESRHPSPWRLGIYRWEEGWGIPPLFFLLRYRLRDFSLLKMNCDNSISDIITKPHRTAHRSHLLGMEPRVSDMWNECSATELWPQPSSSSSISHFIHLHFFLFLKIISLFSETSTL